MLAGVGCTVGLDYRPPILKRKERWAVNTNLLLFKLFFRPVIDWAARRALAGRNRAPYESEKGRFTKVEVDRFLDQSWHGFDEVVPNVSHELTFGSRMNMRLAALSLAMLRTLTSFSFAKIE